VAESVTIGTSCRYLESFLPKQSCRIRVFQSSNDRHPLPQSCKHTGDLVAHPTPRNAPPQVFFTGYFHQPQNNALEGFQWCRCGEKMLTGGNLQHHQLYCKNHHPVITTTPVHQLLSGEAPSRRCDLHLNACGESPNFGTWKC